MSGLWENSLPSSEFIRLSHFLIFMELGIMLKLMNLVLIFFSLFDGIVSFIVLEKFSTSKSYLFIILGKN